MPREIYKNIGSPILDRIGHSEEIHDLARYFLHLAESNPALLRITERLLVGGRFEDERLGVILGGVESGGVSLDNPVLVGAGWDETGKSVRALYRLGFAGVEVGSVLTYPQPGNEKPRQHVVAPGVTINWLGLNTPGVEVVAKNLSKYHGSGIPIGVSVAKNKGRPESEAPEAFAEVIRRIYPCAAYFALNVSCPNVAGELRLQNKDQLVDIVLAVAQTMRELGGYKPTFVKISPDIDKTVVDDFIDVALQHGLTGIIATNTTNNPDVKGKYKYRKKFPTEIGGLSGDDPDFRRMATEKVAHIFRQAGDRLQIIGVGGVKDAETALEKIRAGARVVQVVTAIRGEGPAVARKINQGLVAFMQRERIANLSEIVGK